MSNFVFSAGGSRLVVEPQCCIDLNKEGPFKIYRTESHQCCNDGSVVEIGDFC